MLQRSFEITKSQTLKKVLKSIAQMDEYKAANDRLIVINEPECKRKFIEKELEEIKKVLPEAKIVGMTTLGPLTPQTIAQKNTAISLMLFSKSTVSILEADCHDQDQFKIGALFGQKIQGMDHPQGAYCISSCARLCPDKIIDLARNGNEDVPVFGAQAGSKNANVDESKIFTHNAIYEMGVVFAVFCGKELEITTDFNLGWHPLGSDHRVTESSNGLVSKIDGKPAADLYKKYLGVYTDETFYEHTCAFPLLVPSGNHPVAKVAIGFEGSSMMFSTGLAAGTKVYLAYSKSEYLLKDTLSSANKMRLFHPEAVMIFACMNRRIFMGNENADKEFNYYRQVMPELCWSYGYGEILQTKDGGGILNSTFVAIGFREKSKKKPKTIPLIVDESLKVKPDAVPLADRLVSFLEATSEELHNTILQLENLAEHDQLTGLYNRRKLNEILSYELNKRHKEDDLSVLMFDIDWFKNINDTYGHSEGDHVLVKLSKLVSETIRSCDVLGRWGGEEFICILSNTPLKGAQILAERIRKKVEEADFSPVPKLTISLGITAAHVNETHESFFLRLDKALYDAKKSGRNRTCSR